MDESFERAMESQPVKRKRSSILKPPEKRVSRDSRTVSFNDRYIYKELHQDGTCDITNLFLREDMDVVNNQTINSSMSMDQGSIISNSSDNNSTLAGDSMIDVEASLHETRNNSCQMDLTLISQFMDTMPKINSIEVPSVNYETSTLYDQEMSLASDVNSISSLESYSIANQSIDVEPNISVPTSIKDLSSTDTSQDSTIVPQTNGSTVINNCTLGRISDISSFSNSNLKEDPQDDTFYGAFHDSNNISMQSRTSGLDTMINNLEALNDCVQKVEQETEESRKRLDDEIDDLLKFYKNIVNKDNKYEFAIRIFGLRHSLWLIIKVNPETYPNEKLNLRFAVNKRDRNLYPFPEFAEAVRRCTKENRQGYLTKFVINAQKFRRFLRVSGYRKACKVN